MESSRERGGRWVWGGLLVLLVFLAYAPTLSNGFIWDDDDYVERNPTIRSLEGLKAIWLEPGVTRQYYPLVHTSFWVEYHLWRLKPAGYHAINLALHALAAILVWQLLLDLEIPGAWLAGAIFAVHPVEVESVAWVTERKNVLSLVFALGSLLTYLKFSPANFYKFRGSGWFYLLAFALYVAALLSKTVTVSVPAVLLVLYWWKRGGFSLGEAMTLVPFFAVGLVMAAVTVHMETTNVGASGEDWSFTWLERILIAGRALWFYAFKLAVPYPLVFFYPRWELDAYAWWQWLYPISAVGLIVALWHYREHIGRGPLAAVLIFAGVLVPALGFFNVFPFRYSFVADHFQYHSSIALIALAAAGLAKLGDRIRAAADKEQAPTRWIMAAAAGLVLAPLAGLTFNQTTIYHDRQTLWEHVVAYNPSSFAAHNNLGVILEQAGNKTEAARHFKAALTIRSNHLTALLNYAGVLDQLGDKRGAIEQLEQAQKIQPDWPQVIGSLGKLYVATGNSMQGISLLERAMQLEPRNQKYAEDAGLACLESDLVGSAIEYLTKAIELEPTASALNMRGAAYIKQQKYDQAIADFEAALRLKPDNKSLKDNLERARGAKAQSTGN